MPQALPTDFVIRLRPRPFGAALPTPGPVVAYRPMSERSRSSLGPMIWEVTEPQRGAEVEADDLIDVGESVGAS